MEGERGQATVEWVGLVLAVSVGMTALVAGARGAGGRDGEQAGRALGGAVAGRLVCAVRDGCAAGGGGAGVASPGAPRPGPPALPFVPPGMPGPRGPVPRRDAPRAPTAALGRGATGAVDHAWLVCLGYRRFRYDAEHPRPPTAPLPLDAALEIANDCFNPWAFVF
jgi:hypothetical protein